MDSVFAACHDSMMTRGDCRFVDLPRSRAGIDVSVGSIDHSQKTSA